MITSPNILNAKAELVELALILEVWQLESPKNIVPSRNSSLLELLALCMYAPPE